MPRCLTPSACTATVGRVQRMVDGLDAEPCLAWAHEIAPDALPRFEAWAHPERPGEMPLRLGREPRRCLAATPRWPSWLAGARFMHQRVRHRGGDSN